MLIVPFFGMTQALDGKWYFSEGAYDSGEEHFGKRTLFFEQNECTLSTYKVLEQSFDESAIAMSCTGQYTCEKNRLTIVFEDGCRMTDKLEYTYHFSGDTLIVRNEEYQKNYFFFKKPR